MGRGDSRAVGEQTEGSERPAREVVHSIREFPQWAYLQFRNTKTMQRTGWSREMPKRKQAGGYCHSQHTAEGHRKTAEVEEVESEHSPTGNSVEKQHGE